MVEGSNGRSSTSQADFSPDQPIETASLERRILELGPWFHNMEIHGIRTAPEHFLGDYPSVKFARFSNVLPSNLAGKTVLDIGCNAGFYALEMKRRGAERVLGIDSSDRYLAQARLAAEALKLDVEYQQLSVWEIPALRERFDLVIFMGVFYHLRYPLLALDLIREHVSKDMLLFQSMQRGSRELKSFAPDYPFEQTEIFNQPEWPKMHFVEHGYCADATNWWIPNRAAMEAMLRSSGFGKFDYAADEVYLCRQTPVPEGDDLPSFVFGGQRT